MQPTSVYAVYFSATDTTKRVVTVLAESLAHSYRIPIHTIDFTLPQARQHSYHIPSDAVAVVGLPVYAGRIPNVLLPFLRSSLLGEDTPAVPVVLYGNRDYDDALIELWDVLEENGFHAIAAGAFIGEHSFSRILAADRPDEADLQCVWELARRTAERLERFDMAEDPVQVRGETPVRPYYTPRDRAGNPVNILKVKPKTAETCIGCGLCAAVCPMGSIDPVHPSEISGICIKCGACVKKCPLGAKYYDDERYLYHKTELEEGFAHRAEPELF